MPSAGEVGYDLTRGGPEHEERDKTGDGAGFDAVALPNGHGQLCAVSAHIGNEETAEMQVADGIDYAGERRQEPGKHEPGGFDSQIAAAVRSLRASGGLSHACPLGIRRNIRERKTRDTGLATVLTLRGNREVG